MASVRLVFDRRKTASKSKKGTVEIEILHEGKRKWIGTGVRVYANNWYNKKNVYISGCDNADLLNKTIQTKLREVEDLTRESNFSFDILGKKAVKNSFLAYMENKIDERNDIVKKTKDQHKSALKGLTKFGRIVYFQDLTEKNVRLFDTWLRNKGLQQVSIWGYHKRIKPYIYIAIREGYLAESPYEYFPISKGKPKIRKYLTNEELHRVIDCEIHNNVINKVRDLFIFQCYTGLAYIDIAKFDFERDTEKRGDDYYMIDGRGKNGEIYYLRLLKPAMDVLKKYDYHLPMMSNTKYNLYLKDVAVYANITKNLTTHVARHTFAVWVLNNGTRIEVLSKMLGHTDIKTTQIYAEIVQQSVDDAFEYLSTKI